VQLCGPQIAVTWSHDSQGFMSHVNASCVEMCRPLVPVTLGHDS